MAHLVDLNGLQRFLTKIQDLLAGYFPASGGTINGDTNVAGVLKVRGQQAFNYSASTNSQSVGTNNATGGTTICCGSSSSVTMNGANVKAPNVLPKASNTHTLGSTTYRWKGIYSNAEVNVSSDARMKRDVFPVDDARLVRFIEFLDVVLYNYTDDPEDADARIGLIAQQVQAADPDIAKLFVTEDEEGMLSLRPADLVFPLIVAVQQLSAKVDMLNARVET